jgi:hypothetical protein
MTGRTNTAQNGHSQTQQILGFFRVKKEQRETKENALPLLYVCRFKGATINHLLYYYMEIVRRCMYVIVNPQSILNLCLFVTGLATK